MPARKIVSDRQLELLVSFMEGNRGFAVGRLANNGPLAKQKADELWEELATTLNAVGAGATKTRVKWRDYWNEKKYAVRKKVTELREHGRGTGGGPGKRWSLTPMEERIFAVLGRESVIGNTSVQIPLHPDAAVASAAVLEPEPLDSLPTVASTPVSAPVVEPEPSEASFSHEMDCSLTESTSTASVPTRPPQLAPARRRSYTPHAADVPQWAIQIEERHLANEQRISRSLEAIAATLAAIQRSVERIEEKLNN